MCRLAISARLNHADRQVRRSWHLYNPRHKWLSGPSFEDRAALVMDRDDEAKGSAWAKTMFSHTTCNEIAHGRLRSTRVDARAVVADRHTIPYAPPRAA